MGKSALRLWKKSALTVPADPRPDKHGVKQPAYMRSHTAVQTSARLNAYKRFIRKNMAGKKFANRLAVRRALTRLAHQWKSSHGVETAASEEEYDEEVFWE